MKTLEQAPDFDVEFSLGADFDVNAAFQEAIYGVATDQELAIEEKLRRMEVIVSEGTSEIYREFVDFRSMAAQIELFCNHDHGFNLASQGSETLSSFLDGFKPDDGHNHGDLLSKHSHKDDDEIDPKTGKKRKKRSWFDMLLK